MSTQPPKPKRRWYQFSLKTLLVVVTLFCVMAGWGSWRIQQVRSDQRILARLSEFGPVSAAYNNWGRVEGLHLTNQRVTDAELACLKGLTDLQGLSLHSTDITDAGLEHLKGLKNLEALRLERTQVTDEGVKKLQQALPNCSIRH